MHKKKIRCSLKRIRKRKEKNKIRQKKKKKTWLQGCFLGDVGVICCNSLGDSHSQICVMNNVEIMLDYYLQITPHVSQAFSNCTHITSYSLLSFVHGIVCESSLAIQDYVFYGVWCKICLRVGKNCVFDD